jgi:hypothetical protein
MTLLKWALIMFIVSVVAAIWLYGLVGRKRGRRSRAVLYIPCDLYYSADPWTIGGKSGTRTLTAP